MFFKHVRFFRLQDPELDMAALRQALESHPARACGSQEHQSFGWTPPLGRAATDLVHEANGGVLLCAQLEERLLPPAVVRETVEERVAEIETRENRRVRRKERVDIKDAVVQELLPRAFTRHVLTYGYLDPRSGWLVVEASTATKAENFMALLRESLGSLKARYPLTEDAPAPLMTGWLTGNLPVPEGFVVEDECELRGADSDGVVRCRREDLASQEITALANGGRRVTRLAMSWQERLAFVLKEDLSLASVTMLDLLAEQAAEVEAESEAERLDADFALMTGEFREFFAALLDAFGGEQAQESGGDTARAAG